MELLSALKLEVLGNLEIYGSFMNSSEIDCIEEIDRYIEEKKYSSDTVDLILHAIANVVSCEILLLKDVSHPYILESSHHRITHRPTCVWAKAITTPLLKKVRFTT